MIQVDQNLERIGHQLVRLTALHVDHEAHPAGVVFELRVVKPLFRRRGDARWPRSIFRLLVAAAHFIGDIRLLLPYFLLKIHTCAINVFKKNRKHPLHPCYFMHARAFWSGPSRPTNTVKPHV
jgi:hypothetical protein